MNFEIVLFLIIITGLIFTVYMANRKIKNQDAYIKKILEENSKQLDKLRLKGIEIDRLVRRIKKAENDLHIRIVG